MATPAEMGASLLPNYSIYPHIAAVDDALIRLTRREFSRLMVWMPPQHGKSELISRIFPAWYMGHHPDHRVIQIGYGHSFAKKWSRSSRDLLMQSPFPVQVRSDIKAADHWELKGHDGGVMAAGVGTGISGHRANLMVIDDPIKSAEEAISESYREKIWEWWLSSAKTRLREDGIVVVVQTRWHEEDLSGRLLETEGDDWEVLSLPALAEDDDALGREEGQALCPEMYGKAYLNKIKGQNTPYWWTALYQQRPGKHGAVLWGSEPFREDVWFDDWPGELIIRVMALDPSRGGGTKASDYSAYVMMGATRGGVLYVEADMANDRGAEQLVRDGVGLVQRFRPQDFSVESNAFQDLLRPMFAAGFRKAGLLATPPRAVYNSKNKDMRIERLDEYIQKGLVRFRRTPGTRLLVKQLAEFPMGLHDDGPDAMEMAYRLIEGMVGGGGRETVVGRIGL